MTLVDTSVWIDFLNGKQTPQTSSLLQLMGAGEVLVGDLILTEIFQGIRHKKDVEYAKDLFALYPCAALAGCENALTSAEHYRLLRKKGSTVRKTMDVLIASYCIRHKIPLLFADKDFLPLVEHCGLLAESGSRVK